MDCVAIVYIDARIKCAVSQDVMTSSIQLVSQATSVVGSALGFASGCYTHVQMLLKVDHSLDTNIFNITYVSIY